MTSWNGNYVDLPIAHEEGEFKELFFTTPSRLSVEQWSAYFT